MLSVNTKYSINARFLQLIHNTNQAGLTPKIEAQFSLSGKPARTTKKPYILEGIRTCDIETKRFFPCLSRFNATVITELVRLGLCRQHLVMQILKKTTSSRFCVDYVEKIKKKFRYGINALD